MNELIQYFQEFFGNYLNQAKAAANAALAGLPPIEQVEAASEAGYALRSAKYSADSLVSTLTELESTFSGVLAEAKEGKGTLSDKLNGIAAQLSKAALDAKLTGGELVLKADFDAAIENARSQAVQAERSAAEQAQVQAQLISARRSEVVAAGLSEPLLDAATAANAELLTSDDYKDMAGKVTARVNQLKGLGIQSEDVLKDFAGIAVNQEGDSEFERRFGLQQKIASDIQATKPATRAPFIDASVSAESGTAKQYAAL